MNFLYPEVRLIAINDAPIPVWNDALQVAKGEIGEIVVAGPTVTDAYFNRPEATALAKISEPLADGSKRILHRMGDLAWFDDDGRLWFCGRKSQRVETRSGPIYTEQVEPIFNTHPTVRRSALVGVGERGTQRPVLCVEVHPGRRADAALREELLAMARTYRHTQTIETVLFHPRFPVDIRHNAKIGRETLAHWASKKLGARA